MSRLYNFKLPDEEATPLINLKETVCPVCGKIFFPTPGVWAWKIGRAIKRKPVCSYGCMRKWEKRTKKPPPDVVIRAVASKKTHLKDNTKSKGCKDL